MKIATQKRVPDNHKAAIAMRPTGPLPDTPGPGVQKVLELRQLPVPATIIAELPEARWWFEVFFAMMESQLPILRDALARASRRDHVKFARAFVNLYRLNKTISEFNKQFEQLWQDYNGKLMPAAIEGAGVTNVPLTEGLRVQRAEVWRASIKEGMRAAAYKWLQDNGHGDLITETVNASSLSSLSKELTEEQNISLPGDVFNVHQMPVMSITKMK